MKNQVDVIRHRTHFQSGTGLPGDRSRYYWDSALKAADGWEQYDTDQDAWYFGIWVNVERMQVVTYAEGDYSRDFFLSREAFAAELAHMWEFYGPAPAAFTAIDVETGQVERFVCERPHV